MAHPNPTWLAGKRGRKPISGRWFIRLNDKFGIMADSYNLILTEVHRPNKNAKLIALGWAYTSTVNYMTTVLEKKGFSPDIISMFQNRTKGMTTKIINGKLIISLPTDFISDPNPFVKN